ncbi:MAG: DUF2478 domain-containing protein [Pseudooceanicola sp.]|nr:DUF2478 domain-containing protein [Pseudooceanicola sp.]
MTIAYTMAGSRGGTDLLLAGLAMRLAAKGLRVVGVVQINSDCGPDRPCDMDVRVLPLGPDLRISQSLGPGARGCRLDPEALETAVGLVQASLNTGADLLIVNKFGKHECEGRGFRPVIAEAAALGLPVIVGLNATNRAAFLDFAGDLATELPPDEDALVHWLSVPA